MKKIVKRILGSLLPLVLAFVFVAGTFEVCEMLGTPGVASYVLGSDGGSSPAPAPAPSKKSKKKKKVVKQENTITISGNTVEVSAVKVKKKAQTIKRKYAIVVADAKGKVTYKKKSGNKKITVNKSGNITAKKGLKAGTYNVKVSATAAGNSKFKKKTVTTIVTVKVVKPANPMIVTAKEITVTGAELESAAKTIPVSDAVTVQDAKGAVTYVKTSGDEGISVEGDKIVISTGLAQGTHTFELEVTAAGDAGFEPGTKYVQITVAVN